LPSYTFQTNCEAETEALGERLGLLIADGTAVLLDGPIGAGKTCFTRGLAKGLGFDPADVSSPTFTLVHEHRDGRKLYHMDLYRLESLEEAEEGGLTEYFTDDAVAVVEWPEPVAGLFGPEAVRVYISQPDGEDQRLITFELPEKLARAWEAI